MSETTSIQWCDATFNPWIGCTKVSPGCTNCYAERNFLGVKWGKGKPRYRTSQGTWNRARSWNRLENAKTLASKCRRAGRRPRIFCASLADWLDDEVPIEWLADLLKLIHDTPNLDWLLLTKRPENWRPRLEFAGSLWAETGAPNETIEDWLYDWLGTGGVIRPPANVWLGVSVEDQKRADERISQLLKIPARVRFLSVEPLLGSVDLNLSENGAESEAEESWTKPTETGCLIDWLIVGGESGPNARPCNIEWIRSIVSQCKGAAVPCFVKQLGSRIIGETFEFPSATRFRTGGVSLPAAFGLKHPKGGDPAEWPEDLRVREFPANYD